MWQSGEICFAADHATAAGHFPGHPIIPGALLLDEIVRAIAGGGAAHEIVIPVVKFLAPVRPGDAVHLRWRGRDDRQVTFEGRLARGGHLVVSGTLRLGRAAP